MFDPDDLLDEGYEPHGPGGPMELIDRCAAAGECPDCGEKLIYKGYTKPGSYRAFSVCPNCGYAQEF